MMEETDTSNLKCERIKQLGFKPQKELIYNKLLPYADQLDEESKKMFAEIKANLGNAVMLREIKPGCGIWTARLMIYIRLYGLKFSKEDHIALVHLLYEIVTVPNLEPFAMNKFAQILIMLLKKRYLLSPDDICLPWRPLYDLCRKIISSNYTVLGMYRCFKNLEVTLKALVHAACYYFPENATQEILDELKPMLCPLARSALVMEFLNWFLPVGLPPEKAHLGYKLWFNDFMDLWGTCNNAPSWEPEMMWLMTKLSARNTGYIDWEPYIPIMFTRFLRSLNLPVVYKQCHTSKPHKIHTSAFCLWIVSVLGGGSSCQKYLDKFLKTIESYFHPANFGVWLLKLKELLCKLPHHFIERLHYERYRKPSWETPVPDSHKLTEEDIDRFVESIKGVAMQAIFSKLGCGDVSMALHDLATLRPKIIIPALIERMYSTLDSVTEPHKLTSVMQCVLAVARPLVQGARSDYPEGPTHVIPLLMSTLPGIDPNDLKKCFVTFQFIAIFVTLIPIVDSSKASEHWTDLTEEEEVICAATANFEDFVAQFFDRVFNFVESSSLEATRMEKNPEKRSKIENIAEIALYSVCFSLLSQCSSDIFKTALKKLHTFVTERILETKVAGHFVAMLCRAFSRVNPEETLKCLVPHLCNTVLSLTESEDIQKEEVLSDELLYNMLILSEVVDSHQGILSYKQQIMAVLDRTLHLSCREGYSIAAITLNRLLQSLTAVGPLEHRGLNYSYERDVKEYLPIRDWGKPGNVHNLNLKWHVPCPEEIECVQEIVTKYLPYELDRINKHISDECPLSRESLLCCLNIVCSMFGANSVLPQWTEEPLTLLKTSLKIIPSKLTLGAVGEVALPDGSNIRHVLAHTMNRLQEKLLACAEDDTKSLIAVNYIWGHLLMNLSLPGGKDFEACRKSFYPFKKVLEDRLVGRKRHVRMLLVDRALQQHEHRCDFARTCLTETHKMILLNLLQLSCSHYSEIRTMAQTTLFRGLEFFSFSYSLLVPQLVENLSLDSIENHEKFKGSLYVLLGPKKLPLVSKPDWNVLLKIWPAIVNAKPSEKPSVVKLLNSLVSNVHKHFPTITISQEIPEKCLEAAKKLWTSEPLPSMPLATDSEIEEGLRKLEESNTYNLKMYMDLFDSLVDAVEQNNLHWRYHATALYFIQDLVHPDVSYPARVVKIFLNTLINDSLELRKLAIRSTVHLLKQQKRRHKKITVDVGSLSSEPLPQKPTPGIRPDNMWLQYNFKDRPLTAEEWDRPRYLDKEHIGYYQWPKELKLYAPSHEQPPLDRTENELKPEELEVHEFFSSPTNVAKLIKYFSLEEKKGKDKFNGFRFMLFKGLFRNHGDTFLEVFKPHLEKLVVDKHESSQRCAAEILAGIVRGSKHWPFEKVSALWNFLEPLVRTALSSMTEETVPDWGICFATTGEHRDPNRNHWLMEVLMEDPLRDESSYLGCGRLYALQGALSQQEWRVAELYRRLLQYLRSFLSHPFQNVRERVAGVLTNIFQPDIRLPGGTTSGPHVEDFILEIVPQLEILYSLTFANSEHKKAEPSNHLMVNEIASKLNEIKVSGNGDGKIINLAGESSTEKDLAIRLFKTICKWIGGSISRWNGVLPGFYCIFPLICSLESYDKDEEVGKLCSITLAVMALATTPAEHIPTVFSAIRRVARCDSWWARSSVVDFLQVFTFHNMSLVLSNPEWVTETTDIVLRLLEDERLEVREKAAEVLSGLLHCDFISDTDDLLKQFRTKVGPKVKKLKQKNEEYVRIRHSAILGLCSFINSSPYDVPDCVPDIFFILGNHLNDPQPIPSTIRKTLGDFKRTHHDSWDIHQLKFTDKQLEVLNDLIVPPSYYA